jgi:hypothetical protein
MRLKPFLHSRFARAFPCYKNTGIVGVLVDSHNCCSLRFVDEKDDDDDDDDDAYTPLHLLISSRN